MPVDTAYRVLEGSAYDIGREKARLDGDYLAQSLAHYDEQRNERFDAWLAERAIPFSQAQWPELAEEVRGYIDGSGYDKHAMYRYLYSQAKRRFSCSNLAVRTVDAGPVFAKNTDLCHWEGAFIVFSHYKPERGQEFFGYSYKASFTVQGMNASGLCNGGSSFSGVIERGAAVPEVGGPSQFVSRQVVQYAANVADAVEHWRRAAVFDKPAGYLFLDAAGRCRALNRGLALADVKDCALPEFCTGFFDADRYEYEEGFAGMVQHASARRAYAERSFGSKPEVRLEDVIAFLRSHGPDGTQPGQWCRHHPEDAHLCTCVSHICIPQQRRVLFCHGNPCEAEYGEFAFGA